MTERFDVFFKQAAGGLCPYEWQRQVAQDGLPEILSVPAGFGKTEGAALAWAWRRVALNDDTEPLHLIYCLPMRSLVRQTVERLRKCFGNLNTARYTEVSVHQLMGGAIDDEWAGKPDQPWVLVGTQDQLLSRALNRGYSMSRYKWPVHFGLLNQDCRWIIDEVQLMGPGLWTTAQLDWMRQKRFASIKPCRTTWMSATMAASFLATTDRKTDKCDAAPFPHLNFGDPLLQSRRSAVRPIQWAGTSDPQKIAKLVAERHQAGTLSLVVCNTVETARAIFCDLPATSKILLASRFRRQDREANETRLLEFEDKRRKHAGPIPDDPGLICVSTQVVEAGLDISAHHLWSELPPWASVIQRLGRLNRDGLDPDARAWFWETSPAGRERIGPYDASDIGAAKILLEALIPLSCDPFAEAIGKLEQTQGEAVKRALEPKPEPLPRALDVHGLFATERDVHGGFTDVSVFVRSADPDADLTVFWRDWKDKNSAPPKGEDLDGPDLNLHEEGCPVPVFRLRKFLESQHAAAWTWNDETGQWERIEHSELRPGMVVMLHRQIGGYDSTVGWTGDPNHKLPEVPCAGRGRGLRDDAGTEIGCWVPLNIHLADARHHAEEICKALQLDEPYRTAVIEAAVLHDIGKAHPQWQRALPIAAELRGGPWAKCPRVLAIDAVAASNTILEAVRDLRPDCLELPTARKRECGDVVRLRWAVSRKLTEEELAKLRGIAGVRWAGHVAFRPGLRHEAASALAMWRRYREGTASYPALAVYLAAAHHGKVRTVLRRIKDTGNDAFGVPRDSGALDVCGEPWPLDFNVANDGAEGRWEGGGFLLTGAGWTGLVSDLLGPWRTDDTSHAAVVPDGEPKRLGPFALAYLEALVRAADWRASSNPSQSIKPEERGREHKPA